MVVPMTASVLQTNKHLNEMDDNNISMRIFRTLEEKKKWPIEAVPVLHNILPDGYQLLVAFRVAVLANGMLLQIKNYVLLCTLCHQCMPFITMYDPLMMC